MRSFNGRDILSLKGFEREEYFRVFEVADELAPFARNRRNTDLLKEKTLVTAFYQPSTRTAWLTKLPCIAWAVMSLDSRMPR
jgi:aspartate carbamoyltransferase catalytic subunit